MPKLLAPGSVYDRVVRHIFLSGAVRPGSKLVESQLAARLGVSRIPIRESLRRLAGQGMLVSERDGVRLRVYSAEEVRQLYEVRELLEGGAARAAARAATEADLERLEMICRAAEALTSSYGSTRWADLDHAFHTAIAEASHNERIASSLTALLTECHYVFYMYPWQARPKPTRAASAASRKRVLREHRTLLRRIRSRDADAAEQKARLDMQASSKRITQALLSMDINR